MMSRSQAIMEAWFLAPSPGGLPARLVRSLGMRIRRFGGDQAASVLVYTALASTMLVGMSGLSVDVGTWYANKRALQSATDAAAVAGALEAVRSGNDDTSSIEAAVKQDAKRNGARINPGDSDTITIIQPRADAVEVVLERKADLFFSGLFLNQKVTIRARAVAEATDGEACIWALNPTASPALNVTGAAVVDVACGVRVNSSGNPAFDQGGSGCLTATEIRVHGGYSYSCNTTPVVGTGRVYDPLADFVPPTPGSCDVSGDTTINGDNPTFSPGADGMMVFCGDLTIKKGTVTLDPGLYIFKDGASLSVQAQGALSGSGVFIYLDGAGELNLLSGATVTLTAPNSGLYSGMVLSQDRTEAGISHKLAGGPAMQISGIIYLPAQTVDFHGGATSGNVDTMLIADKINFTGNSVFKDAVFNAPNSTALISVKLVE